MAPYTEILPAFSEEPGINEEQFETALQVWSWMQDDQHRPTVARAALAFNTTPEIVRTAIGASQWMIMDWLVDEHDPTKQFIGHDGE